VTTRGAFHRQGPFVGSGGHYSPGPATAPPPRDDVTTAERRSHVVLGLSRSFTLFKKRVEADSPATLSLETLFGIADRTLSRRPPEECPLLGPRSLAPPLFLERCVRAYSGPGCCLPTSATKPRRTDTGHGTLVSSQGRWP